MLSVIWKLHTVNTHMINIWLTFVAVFLHPNIPRNMTGGHIYHENVHQYSLGPFTQRTADCIHSYVVYCWSLHWQAGALSLDGSACHTYFNTYYTKKYVGFQFIPKKNKVHFCPTKTHHHQLVTWGSLRLHNDHTTTLGITQITQWPHNHPRDHSDHTMTTQPR